MTGTIELSGMEFYAFHGCFAEEQIVGTHFIVDLWLEIDIDDAANDDDISKTVNYLEAYQLIKKEMAINSKILENIALRIITSLYKQYPIIKKITIKISKLNPPLGGKLSHAAITITK